MKKLSLLVMAALALILVAGIALAEEKEEPSCEQCGMYLHKSPTQVSAVIAVGEEEFSHQFESMGCYIGYVRANYDKDAKFLELNILDYNTFDDDDQVMLNATKATYLYGTEPLKGSMGPFIATFATEDAAKNAQTELGGELMGYKTMMKTLMADVESGAAGGCACCGGCGGDKGTEEGDGDVYSCAMGCVDSPTPGKCPKCGMEMQKKEK